MYNNKPSLLPKNKLTTSKNNIIDTDTKKIVETATDEVIVGAAKKRSLWFWCCTIIGALMFIMGVAIGLEIAGFLSLLAWVKINSLFIGLTSLFLVSGVLVFIVSFAGYYYGLAWFVSKQHINKHTHNQPSKPFNNKLNSLRSTHTLSSSTNKTLQTAQTLCAFLYKQKKPYKNSTTYAAWNNSEFTYNSQRGIEFNLTNKLNTQRFNCGGMVKSLLKCNDAWKKEGGSQHPHIENLRPLPMKGFDHIVVTDGTIVCDPWLNEVFADKETALNYYKEALTKKGVKSERVNKITWGEEYNNYRDMDYFKE